MNSGVVYLKINDKSGELKKMYLGMAPNKHDAWDMAMDKINQFDDPLKNNCLRSLVYDWVDNEHNISCSAMRGGKKSRTSKKSRKNKKFKKSRKNRKYRK